MKGLFARYPLLIPLGILCLAILLGYSAYFYPSLPSVFREWILRKEIKSVLLKSQTFCQTQGERSFFDGELLGFYQEGKFHALYAPLRWYVGSPECSAKPGLLYRTRARFRLPHRYQNPSSFDYPAYLKVQGLIATASIGSAEELVGLSEDDSWVFGTRQSGLNILQKARLTPEIRQVLLGLFWGFKPTESSGLMPIFRDTGLAHLLVVSGFHFTLIFGIFYFVFRTGGFFFGGWGDRGWVRKGAMGLALFPALLFGFWVGLGPPVLRALISVFLWVLIEGLDGPRDFLSLGLWVAFVMLLWWPPWLFDPGFLLSFGAAFTLLIFARRVGKFLEFFEERFRRPWNKIFYFILAVPLATVAVNGVLYPLMAYYFHRISWVAPLANALVEPSFNLVLMPGLLTASLMAPGWEPGAILLVEHLGKLTEWIWEALKILAAWKGAAAWVGPPGVWIWAAWGLGVLLFLGTKGWRFFLLSLLLLGSLGVIDRAVLAVAPSGRLKLSVLDVGQGDALLLELPDGSALLVDGGGIPGGDFDIGEKVVLPELLRRGIRELRALVLTHPDADHAFGFISLAGQLKVREFWTPELWSGLEEVPPLKEILHGKKIPIRPLDHSHSLFATGVSFEVLWPPSREEAKHLELSRNDQSLVLRICYGDVCFLLTGDLEARGEDLLLRNEAEVRSRVLKIGHHGSRSSTTLDFLRSVDPQYALISAGKDNRFGMPHKEVLHRLETSKIKWFSTERNGQIGLETDGKEIFIETFVPALGREPGPREELGRGLQPYPDGPIPNY